MRFVHHWNYVRVLELPQVAAILDMYPYGGCLTTLEALCKGRPVLTRPSRFIRGRFSLAMYRQMGLVPGAAIHRGAYDDDDDDRHHHRDRDRPGYGGHGSGSAADAADDAQIRELGLVARSKEEFVDFAVRLGTDLRHRAAATAAVREGLNALHRNDAAGSEWAGLFWRLAGKGPWPPVLG